MKIVQTAVLTVIITAGVFFGALSMRGQSQTTPEEREKLRDMIVEYNIGNQAVTDLQNKLNKQFQESKEVKARDALKILIDADVKKLQDKCTKAGKVLGIDQNKVGEFLRCNSKQVEKKGK